eukprot:TRINITY_DN259_c3_g1_i1.p1 TRINITY_DN259_c3_g1~~TRINITY_DN259_c3_g1_i1.p1  ORF type:complete len:500 (+),score=97.67 TRINITY_DN259_c3_g1_i1:878-2377(+)
MSCNGCRVLRKGCSESCILRPCLTAVEGSDAQGSATLFLAKFYGRAGLMGFIQQVNESQRPALFQSLLYEACGRTINPVYGAAGLLWSGQWSLCEAAVENVLKGGTPSSGLNPSAALSLVPSPTTSSVEPPSSTHSNNSKSPTPISASHLAMTDEHAAMGGRLRAPQSAPMGGMVHSGGVVPHALAGNAAMGSTFPFPTMMDAAAMSYWPLVASMGTNGSVAAAAAHMATMANTSAAMAYHQAPYNPAPGCQVLPSYCSPSPMGMSMGTIPNTPFNPAWGGAAGDTMSAASASMANNAARGFQNQTYPQQQQGYGMRGQSPMQGNFATRPQSAGGSSGAQQELPSYEDQRQQQHMQQQQQQQQQQLLQQQQLQYQEQQQQQQQQQQEMDDDTNLSEGSAGHKGGSPPPSVVAPVARRLTAKSGGAFMRPMSSSPSLPTVQAPMMNSHPDTAAAVASSGQMSGGAMTFRGDMGFGGQPDWAARTAAADPSASHSFLSLIS